MRKSLRQLRTLAGNAVPVLLTARDLGAQLVYCRQWRTALQHQRVDAAVATCGRISRLPLETSERAYYVRSAALPMAIFGCQAAWYSASVIDRLRAACVRA
eukprot:5312104-Alexandrium_andersonii.AAC.1